MNLKTRYLGLELAHPIVPGASPLVDNLDSVRRLEDAGAAAIVMHSLFEEQITMERAQTLRAFESHTDTFAEAQNFFPRPSEFRLGPHEYLEQIRRVRAAVQVPVIASLNGVSASGWLDYAQYIQDAGAEALELNIYHVATDPRETAESVESTLLAMVRAVTGRLRIPVAVKLSPYHTAFAHLSRELQDAGAKGLVLFNRLYQPDIDIETLETVPRMHLSDSSELPLRLRWLSIISGKCSLDLAASGGVHTATDAVKALMTGATVVQIVSAILRDGPKQLTVIRDELERWLESHEYASLEQLRGNMNLSRCPDPSAFERGHYIKILQGWQE